MDIVEWYEELVPTPASRFSWANPTADAASVRVIIHSTGNEVLDAWFRQAAESGLLYEGTYTYYLWVRLADGRDYQFANLWDRTDVLDGYDELMATSRRVTMMKLKHKLAAA